MKQNKKYQRSGYRKIRAAQKTKEQKKPETGDFNLSMTETAEAQYTPEGTGDVRSTDSRDMFRDTPGKNKQHRRIIRTAVQKHTREKTGLRDTESQKGSGTKNTQSTGKAFEPDKKQTARKTYRKTSGKIWQASGNAYGKHTKQETGKTAYKLVTPAWLFPGTGRRQAAHPLKETTFFGIEFLHGNNGEEDDNSGTEAAGTAVRTGSRFQDFIMDRLPDKRKQGSKEKQNHRSGRNGQQENTDFKNEKSFQPPKQTGAAPERTKREVNKRIQKQRLKREYAKAVRSSRETGEKAAGFAKKAAQETVTAAKKLAEIAARNVHVLVILGVVGIILLMITTGISSCAAMFGGGLADVMAGSYQSLPAEIDKADESMTLKEMKLQETIDRIETDHPGYDEYTYNLAAIGHNPFTLINFLSAKHIEFTAADVESEVQDLFDQMYELTLTEREETRTRTVKKTRKKVDPDTGEETDEDEEYEEEEEYTVTILETVLTATPLESVISSELTGETGEFYSLYQETKGARQEFYTPLDLDWQSYIKSYYGYRKNPLTGARQFHRGVDISVPEGTPVYASQSGTVVTAAYDEDYGIYIVIEDSGGYMTKYAHLESRSVNAGDSVRHGQMIGRTGSTGSVTGSHLHIECLYNGEYYNPLFYFENGEGSLYDSDAPDVPVSGDVEALLNEAKKYLGYPYVWGGSNPTTSFDCSGFVCWVLTNSGFYNMPRTTAQGIYNKCAHIDPGDAQPGDIIFFTGTYKSGNPVSHVGIYCGNGIMIHAGDPIKYSNINTTYWQSHFYGYGRLSGMP